MRRYDRKWLGLFAASSRGNRIFSSESGSHVRGPFCQAVTLIVSDIVVVAFIEAYPGGRSPYGQLPETTPPLVEAPPRSEAPPAETGTGPSPRVGALPDRRRAARLHGGPRAHGVRRNLHRAAPTVLATLAPRHPEGHWRGPGVRGDPRIPHVSQGTVHGVPIGSDLGEGDGSETLRGSGHRGKPGTVCRNGTEPTAASRNASTESGPMNGVVVGRQDHVCLPRKPRPSS